MTTVKPLDWVLEDLGLWKAQTNLIACYSVWDCGDHWECSLLDGQFPSADAAKSAAFADYSARIMSAIEPAGVGVDAAIRSAGLKARDELLERMADGGTVDNDLADYMERIVDACVRASLKGDEQ